ncbi:hypothetical protein F5144DRAFT_45230 [Chaetomium tenue]|uniref:Uncharacterized protein n=1 Tax=Chaetomium tenue TaxID=1854479 RepID=A0ACB7PR13_9PEZI|nr:hypothetical protein F5144DRAFT_45230 [Chaetomium globosum]
MLGEPQGLRPGICVRANFFMTLAKGEGNKESRYTCLVVWLQGLEATVKEGDMQEKRGPEGYWRKMDAFGGLCPLAVAVAERGREGEDEEIWCDWCDWCESSLDLPPWADGGQERHGNIGEYQSFFLPGAGNTDVQSEEFLEGTVVVERPGWAVVCPALAARHSSPEMDQAGLPREKGTRARRWAGGRDGSSAPGAREGCRPSRLGRFDACLKPVEPETPIAAIIGCTLSALSCWMHWAVWVCLSVLNLWSRSLFTP